MPARRHRVSMRSIGNPTPPTFVFVHGFLGFVRIPMLPNVTYFRRLEPALRRWQVPCMFPAVPNAGTVEARAKALAQALKSLGNRPVVLVGASMGGLDARYLTNRLQEGERVRAVVSVGTPHRGSPVADWALAGELPVPRFLLRRWCPAIEDLRPETCEQRNDETADRPDVTYLSCAGMRPPSHLPWPLADYARRMQPTHGDNDGLVPVTSARWGRFLGVHQADHVELIGWRLPRWAWTKSRPFDHLRLYRNLISQALAASGAPILDDVQGD
ncbi:MAG: alpha/beta fold hydrolase [Alphaproteobacteria bacterium]